MLFVVASLKGYNYNICVVFAVQRLQLQKKVKKVAASITSDAMATGRGHARGSRLFEADERTLTNHGPLLLL